MTGCSYQASLLCKLHRFCPQLESLRMGSLAVRQSQQGGAPQQERAASKALLQSLPRLLLGAVQESWEDEQQLQVLWQWRLSRTHCRCCCLNFNGCRLNCLQAVSHLPCPAKALETHMLVKGRLNEG